MPTPPLDADPAAAASPRAAHRVPRRPHAWIAFAVAAHLLVAAAWIAWGWRAGLPALVLVHLAFVAATLLPNAALLSPVLSRLDTDARACWLTIDDGPSDDTAALLDLLDAHRAKATFFLVGARAAARPELVRAIAARGHGIGNHSQHHPQAVFWALGPTRIRREVLDCQRTLAAITGTAPRWFRAVVGHANPFLAAPLRAAGLARVGWTARGYDAVRDDVEAVAARICDGLSPGAIVLLHEGAAHGRCVAMVAAVLARMEDAGYRAVVPE